MANATFNLIYREGVQEPSLPVHHEWIIEKRIDQLIQREPFATLDIDSKEKPFTFKLLKPEGHYHFLPRLMESVGEALKMGWDHKNAKLSLKGLEEFIRLSGFNTGVGKRILLEWLKVGGDPNAIFFREEKPVSLVIAAFKSEGCDLLDRFLEEGVDSYSATTTSTAGTIITTTLPHIAILFNRLDLLEHLISKKIDFNRSSSIDPYPPSTPLCLAVRRKAHTFIKVLLEKGTPLNKLKLSHLIQIACDNHDEEAVSLLLASTGQTFPKIYSDSFIKHFELRKSLGHRFGIALDIYDTGYGFSLELPTEWDRNRLEKDLKESIDHFVTAYPRLSPSKLNNYFKLLFPEDPPSPSALLKAFQNNEPVLFKGFWPRHFTRLALVNKILFVFNRGALRDDAPPGIQIFIFDDPSKLTEEHISKLQKSPDLLLSSQKRKEIGLEEMIFDTFIDKTQPGRFCFWNNSKLCIKFLFAISHLPKNEYNTPQEFLNELKKGFEKIPDVYTVWTTFDREREVEKAVSFYQEHPEIIPDFPLLLFVLANFKGNNHKLITFLDTQPLKRNDFLHRDNQGKNLLHHVCDVSNLDGLAYLADDDSESLFSALINLPTQTNERPLERALKKRNWVLAGELLSYGAYLFDDDRRNLYKGIFENDSLPMIYSLEEEQYEFEKPDLHGKTALHAAIEHQALLCIEYFATQKASLFFPTQKERKEYLEFALELKQPDIALRLFQLLS